MSEKEATKDSKKKKRAPVKKAPSILADTKKNLKAKHSILKEKHKAISRELNQVKRDISTLSRKAPSSTSTS